MSCEEIQSQFQQPKQQDGTSCAASTDVVVVPAVVLKQDKGCDAVKINETDNKQEDTNAFKKSGMIRIAALLHLVLGLTDIGIGIWAVADGNIRSIAQIVLGLFACCCAFLLINGIGKIQQIHGLVDVVIDMLDTDALGDWFGWRSFFIYYIFISIFSVYGTFIYGIAELVIDNHQNGILAVVGFLVYIWGLVWTVQAVEMKEFIKTVCEIFNLMGYISGLVMILSCVYLFYKDYQDGVLESSINLAEFHAVWICGALLSVVSAIGFLGSYLQNKKIVFAYCTCKLILITAIIIVGGFFAATKSTVNSFIDKNCVTILKTYEESSWSKAFQCSKYSEWSVDGVVCADKNTLANVWEVNIGKTSTYNFVPATGCLSYACCNAMKDWTSAHLIYIILIAVFLFVSEVFKLYCQFKFYQLLSKCERDGIKLKKKKFKDHHTCCIFSVFIVLSSVLFIIFVIIIVLATAAPARDLFKSALLTRGNNIFPEIGFGGCSTVNSWGMSQPVIVGCAFASCSSTTMLVTVNSGKIMYLNNKIPAGVTFSQVTTTPAYAQTRHARTYRIYGTYNDIKTSLPQIRVCPTCLNTDVLIDTEFETPAIGRHAWKYGSPRLSTTKIHEYDGRVIPCQNWTGSQGLSLVTVTATTDTGCVYTAVTSSDGLYQITIPVPDGMDGTQLGTFNVAFSYSAPGHRTAVQRVVVQSFLTSRKMRSSIQTVCLASNTRSPNAKLPTRQPTLAPSTAYPTSVNSKVPTTRKPTSLPTYVPTHLPTLYNAPPTAPTERPTTRSPITNLPTTFVPTPYPTAADQWYVCQLTGQQDQKLVGLAGVLVKVYEDPEKSAMKVTETNSSGYFSFRAVPNCYSFSFTQLPATLASQFYEVGSTTNPNLIFACADRLAGLFPSDPCYFSLAPIQTPTLEDSIPDITSETPSPTNSAQQRSYVQVVLDWSNKNQDLDLMMYMTGTESYCSVGSSKPYAVGCQGVQVSLDANGKNGKTESIVIDVTAGVYSFFVYHANFDKNKAVNWMNNGEPQVEVWSVMWDYGTIKDKVPVATFYPPVNTKGLTGEQFKYWQVFCFDGGEGIYFANDLHKYSKTLPQQANECVNPWA